MKRTVLVTITKHVDVEISDGQLTPEALEGFSATMFPVDAPDDLFKFAAGQVAAHEDHFVEGLGRAVSRSTMRHPTNGKPLAGLVVFEIPEHDVECQVLPDPPPAAPEAPAEEQQP
jgi:hypothetical protein